MRPINWIVTLSLLSVTPLTAGAERHCPGNVASLPYRVVNRHQAIVTVSLNDHGPYSFLLDTGTQMTMIDQELARDLGLKMEGRAAVISATVNDTAALAKIDNLSAGTRKVSDLKVVVYSFRNLGQAMKVQGVLGDDFLEKFDVLIDNKHGQLCLDDSGGMRAAINGQRVPLLDSGLRDDQRPPRPLIISARLSDGLRPVRLKLDSGANESFLYRPTEYLAIGNFRGASLPGRGVDGKQRILTELPTQGLQIGQTVISRVPFFTLLARQDDHTSDFDGLLSTGVFRSIFIDRANHFVVIDPL